MMHSAGRLAERSSLNGSYQQAHRPVECQRARARFTLMALTPHSVLTWTQSHGRAGAAQAQRKPTGTLEYYNRLMQVLGARGVQEVNDKTAQTDRFVRFAHKTVEDYIDLLERTTERMQRYQAPPPPPEPPPWDRIIAALAPSVAVIYTETVRAIKGRH